MTGGTAIAQELVADFFCTLPFPLVGLVSRGRGPQLQRNSYINFLKGLRDRACDSNPYSSRFICAQEIPRFSIEYTVSALSIPSKKLSGSNLDQELRPLCTSSAGKCNPDEDPLGKSTEGSAVRHFAQHRIGASTFDSCSGLNLNPRSRTAKDFEGDPRDLL